jgi:hypothetical protein
MVSERRKADRVYMQKVPRRQTPSTANVSVDREGGGRGSSEYKGREGCYQREAIKLVEIEKGPRCGTCTLSTHTFALAMHGGSIRQRPSAAGRSDAACMTSWKLLWCVDAWTYEQKQWTSPKNYLVEDNTTGVEYRDASTA